MVDDHKREVTFPGPWHSIQEFMDANAAVGYYFFSPATMKAFSSRVSQTLHAGRLFVTSERSRYGGTPRKYTVRVACDDATVGRIEKLGEYHTLEAAHSMARVIVKGGGVTPDDHAESEGGEG